MPPSMQTAALALTLTLLSGAAQADALAEANARLDRALAEIEGCQTLFDVAALPGDRLEVVLEAGCRGNQMVTLDHGGITLRLTTSPAGRLFAQIPMLAATAPVTLVFADGRMEEQLPPVQELRRAEAGMLN